MRKLISLFLVVFSLSFIIGCYDNVKNSNLNSNSDSKQNLTSETTPHTSFNNTESEGAKKSVVKIKWEFENYTKKETGRDDIEYPYTDLYLVIKDQTERKELVGTFKGSMLEIKDFVKHDFPLNSILACQYYYAGSGGDVYISFNEDKLIIKSRNFYEPEEDVEYTKPNFDVLKTISLPVKSKVEIIK